MKVLNNTENLTSKIIDPLYFEEQTDTILRSNVRLLGELSSKDKVMIQCEFEGKITDGYEICIGPNAKFKGDINAQIVYIFGEVIGNVSAKKQISLLEGGILRGNMLAPMTSKDPNSTLQGRMDSSTGV